nr:oligosaccharide flippase family protein [Kofleriaceae bacterium]
MPAAESETHISTKINRGVAWSAASQTVVAIADLLSQAFVVALWMSKFELGIVMAAVPLYSILDAAADLGVTSALIQRDDHTPERVSTVFWFNVLLSFGLFAILCVAGPLYGMLQGYSILGWLLIAYGGKLIAQNFYAIPYALLRKQLQFEEVAKIRTVAYLTESVTRVVFAAMGWTIWCFTLAAIAKTVVFAILMQWRHPFWPKLVFKWREVEPYVKFGMRSAASSLLYYTYTNLDYPIVAYYFGADANGVYSLAFWIVLEAVKTIANVIIDVAFPTFARLRDDHDGLIREFIKLTRLSLIAILPFVVLVALVVPEFLQLVYAGGTWDADTIQRCTTACRILCFVGVLRALGYIGPPLLDGIGRPGLTLRYMLCAAIVVPLGFVASAQVLGPMLGADAMLSVPIAWAVAYPLAFVVLGFLVQQSIDLPIGRYAKSCMTIVACAAGGLATGFAVRLAVTDLPPAIRMVLVGAGSLAGTFALLAFWQNITPRSIAASLKG